MPNEPEPPPPVAVLFTAEFKRNHLLQDGAGRHRGGRYPSNHPRLRNSTTIDGRSEKRSVSARNGHRKQYDNRTRGRSRFGSDTIKLTARLMDCTQFSHSTEACSRSMNSFISRPAFVMCSSNRRLAASVSRWRQSSSRARCSSLAWRWASRENSMWRRM